MKRTIIIVGLILIASLVVVYYLPWQINFPSSDNNRSKYLPGTIIVTMNDEVGEIEARAFFKDRNLELYNERVLFETTYVISVSDGQEEYWIQELKKYPEVRGATLNKTSHVGF